MYHLLKNKEATLKIPAMGVNFVAVFRQLLIALLLISITSGFSACKQQRIEALIRQLENYEENLAADTMENLIAIGSPAVEPLIDVLCHANPPVRMRAISCLGNIGDRRAIPALVRVLQKDPNCDVRISARVNLERFGWHPRNEQEQVAYYLASLTSSADSQAAMVAMGSRATELLIGLLEEGCQVTGIVNVLAKLPDATSTKALKRVALSRKAFPYACDDAARALRDRGWKPSTKDELITFLIAEENWDELTRIGSPALPQLITLIDEADCCGPSVVGIAGPMQVIGRIGESEGLKVLLRTIRRASEAWLKCGHTSHRSIGPPLEKRIYAAHKRVLFSCWDHSIDALAKAGSSAIDLLTEALRDADVNVRDAALLVLSENDDPAVTSILLRYYGLRDLKAVALDYNSLILKGMPGTEHLLVKALERYGTLSMAQEFLDSENRKLSTASRLWASQHGYEIIEVPGSNIPTWHSSQTSER